MYAVHTTPGFVIDSRPYGEAGKILSLFTRDLGLVSAIAQGIRLEKSKLRYYVQNHTFAIFSLVRGKEFWRLTSAASEHEEEVALTPVTREIGVTRETLVARELTARLAALLKRLLQGEESHPELFELVSTCYAFMAASPGITAEQAKSLESLTVLRILHVLGYVGTEAEFAAHIASTPALDLAMLDAVTPMRQLMNRHINNALKESHL